MVFTNRTTRRSRPQLRVTAKEFRRVKNFVDPFSECYNTDPEEAICMLFPRALANKRRIDALEKEIEEKLSMDFEGLSKQQQHMLLKTLRPDLVGSKGFLTNAPDINIVQDSEENEYDFQEFEDFPIELPCLVSTSNQIDDDDVQTLEDSARRSSMSNNARKASHIPGMLNRRSSVISSSFCDSRRISAQAESISGRRLSRAGTLDPKILAFFCDGTMSNHVRSMKPSDKYAALVENKSTAPVKAAPANTEDINDKLAMIEMHKVTSELENWSKINLDNPKILSVLHAASNKVSPEQQIQNEKNCSQDLSVCDSDDLSDGGEFDVLLNACRPAILENKMPIRLNVVHEMHPPEALVQGLRDQLGLTIKMPKADKKSKKKSDKMQMTDKTPTRLQIRLRYGAWYVPVGEWKGLQAKRDKDPSNMMALKRSEGISSIVQQKLDEISLNREREEKIIMSGIKESKKSIHVSAILKQKQKKRANLGKADLSSSNRGRGLSVSQPSHDTRMVDTAQTTIYVQTRPIQAFAQPLHSSWERKSSITSDASVARTRSERSTLTSENEIPVRSRKISNSMSENGGRKYRGANNFPVGNLRALLNGTSLNRKQAGDVKQNHKTGLNLRLVTEE